jgi:hypothetical protein
VFTDNPQGAVALFGSIVFGTLAEYWALKRSALNNYFYGDMGS